MKKWILLSVLFAAMPLSLMAQDDDLYFNPKQEAKQRAAEREAEERELASHYSGSKRDVDEYNRGGKFMSKFTKVGTDSLGNDIITFRVGRGVSPDSIYDDADFVQKYLEDNEDYEYTRDLSRWDGYYNPWFYDYYGYGPYYWSAGYWGWRNPWRYGYYAGWYDPWYDPWYYGYAGWYWGWHSPWYYGWWGGWYDPWYWGRPVVAHVNYGPSGAIRKNYGFKGGQASMANGTSNGRNALTRRNVSNRNFGSRTTYNNRSTSNSNRTTTYSNSSSAPRQGGFSGGSFGGGRSGGGGFSGGGFGGRRR